MHYTTSCNTLSSAPEDGQDQRPKHTELIEINKPLLLHLVRVYIIYSLNMLYKLLNGCFLLLKVTTDTLQVYSVTVNGRTRTVDCHHDITVSTVRVVFLVNEGSRYYFLFATN